MKKPWLSAILNLFFLGVGYLYNGRRVAMGLILLLSFSISSFFYADKFEKLFSEFLEFLISSILISLALSIDAYQEAKLINEELVSKKK
ncbi:MAG: hypothetical protein NZL96_01120 [Patescibacteria group bacterium]|nr:hypothetical protein [Patescibacteria group bacterium]